jgi:phosphotransferase system enzyme I (PtsI)
LATVELETCRRAAEAALAEDDPAAARAAVRDVMTAAG